jgi:hypothetical protein
MGRRKPRIGVKADLDRARTGPADDVSRPGPVEALPQTGSNADDVEQYLHHLAHLDMALPLKIALVRSVRDLMQGFVDRAFGDDPSQLALQAGGNWNKTDSALPDEMVDWPLDSPTNPDMLTCDFRHNAETQEEKANEK